MLMLKEILPPLMTAPLNKAMACCVSELDEPVAAEYLIFCFMKGCLGCTIRCISAEKFGHLHLLSGRHLSVVF